MNLVVSKMVTGMQITNCGSRKILQLFEYAEHVEILN